MKELWRHLRETGNVRAYLLLLLRRHSKTLAFLGLALAIALAFALQTRGAIKRERIAQLAACGRVQHLRDQSNASAFLIYDTFKQVRAQQATAVNSGQLKGVALKQAKQSRDRAGIVVKDTTVTGPTDCNEAIDHPETYSPPIPEPIDSNSPRVKAARARVDALVK